MSTLLWEPVVGSVDVAAPLGATPADLLDAARHGDPEGWRGLVERYERLVWSIARGFRYDDATTADVVQTVWLRLAEHLEGHPDGLLALVAHRVLRLLPAAVRDQRLEQARDLLVELGALHVVHGRDRADRGVQGGDGEDPLDQGRLVVGAGGADQALAQLVRVGAGHGLAGDAREAHRHEKSRTDPPHG